MKPPRVIFLTESGRFETGMPVCLSITSYHSECWLPTWYKPHYRPTRALYHPRY